MSVPGLRLGTVGPPRMVGHGPRGGAAGSLATPRRRARGAGTGRGSGRGSRARAFRARARRRASCSRRCGTTPEPARRCWPGGSACASSSKVARRARPRLGGSRGRRPPGGVKRAPGVVAHLATKAAGLYRVRFEDVFGAGPRRARGGPPPLAARRGRGVSRGARPGPLRPRLVALLRGRGRPQSERRRGVRAGHGPGRPADEGDERRPQRRAAPRFTRPAARSRRTATTRRVSWRRPTSGNGTSWCLRSLAITRSPSRGSPRRPGPRACAWSCRAGATTRRRPTTTCAFWSTAPVAETTWDGKREQIVEAELPAGLLAEGANAVTLENVGDTPAAYSMVFLNRFEISYPRTVTAQAGVLEGIWFESGAALVSGPGRGGRRRRHDRHAGLARGLRSHRERPPVPCRSRPPLPRRGGSGVLSPAVGRVSSTGLRRTASGPTGS